MPDMRTLRSLDERLHGEAVHREQLRREGYTDRQLRAAAHAPDIQVHRRAWFVSAEAASDLHDAARFGGRITCTSLARRRGWWMPDEVGDELHLHLLPGSTGPRVPEAWPGVTHWTQPMAPTSRSLVGAVEDALAHIAACVPRDTALVLWESAARVERLAPEALRQIRWRPRAAVELAGAVTGLADSGLEVIVCTPLRRLGVAVRQQVWLAGKPVDVLVGERLVIQIDGWAHHSSAAQRAKDIAHDAELRLRGYTVFRFSYAQVVHGWPEIEGSIRRAMAAGLHRVVPIG